jgi:precorrin-3B C17-methyltransferase
MKKGKLSVVGTGPGSGEHITPRARTAVRRAEAVVGYKTYLDLIPDLVDGKKLFSTGMTQEIERCQKAVDLAMEGKDVAVISGGDPGIYAMAGLVFEIMRTRDPRSTELPEIEIIPGISALNASAALLGAPLMHDFASVSLSDRLTPWETIEKRLEAAAAADFVIILYNPRSKGRSHHIDGAREIILRHRAAATPVGIVRAAMREDEAAIVTTLEHMLEHDIDMQTTVIIGNSQTIAWGRWMVTPRGYERKLGA